MVGADHSNPVSVRRWGGTQLLLSTSVENSPSAAFNANAGTGRNEGRCRASASALVASALVTGWGP